LLLRLGEALEATLGRLVALLLRLEALKGWLLLGLRLKTLKALVLLGLVLLLLVRLETTELLLWRGCLVLETLELLLLNLLLR